MAYAPRGGSSHNNLSASYYPGQDDDFQIPVISPVPQRNNPEMSDHITQNLSRLELEARPSSTVSDLHSPLQQHANGYPQYQQYQQQQQQQQQQQPQQQPYQRESQQPRQQHTPPQPQQQQQQQHQPPPQQQQQRQAPPQGAGYGARNESASATPAPVPEDEPSFNPFPTIRDRKLNVPPSDEEKEGILEKARDAVLNSNDPEMQLAWAQDTLAYADIAQQNEQRLSEFRLARPQTPKTERRLRVDAVNVVDFLAQQHHPKAEFIRGTWLEFGRFGFEMDKREAFRCYSRSAQSGYARAEYRMGMQFEASNEIEKAVRHYGLGVQARDAASNYRMGMMMLLGQQGQPQDFARGLEMIRFSADNADENAPQGAYVYGMLHVRELPQVTVPEQFLPYDVDLARLNIEKAAYLGFAKAQVKMGAAYELAELNCEFDPVLSLHYNNLAARQGEADAEMAISKWFLSGYEGIFAKNEAMAFAYAQRAATTGLATAEFAMGYFYEVGIHVHSSLKEAQAWYAKSAEHGNKDATGRIDGISRSKTLSRKDHDKVAMARLKSTRGTRPQGGYQSQQPAAEPVSMPHIPETYGQSYAQGTPPGQKAYGPRPSSSQPPYNPGYGPQAQIPQARPPQYGSPAPPQAPAYPSGQYDRPYSNPAAQAYGRPPPARSPAPPQHSQTIGPTPGYGPQYPPQQGYRPGPNMPPPQQQRLPQAAPQNRVPPGQLPPQPPASPLPNIGFTAPPDFSGADRRRLPQASPANKPLPGPGRPGYGAPSAGPQSRPPPAQAPAPARNPRLDSVPQQPPPFSKPTPPVSTNPTKPPPAAAGSKPSKFAGKGPSTFEEMGVPQQKKNEDCVVM